MSQQDHCCGGKHHSVSTVQSLAEMDFERGLWGASLENDVGRVRQLLKKGVDASAKDSSGF